MNWPPAIRLHAAIGAALVLGACGAAPEHAGDGGVHLAQGAQVWLDARAEGSAAAIRSGRHDASFAPIEERAPSFGSPDGQVWLKIDRTLLDRCTPCLVDVGTPTADRIDIWRRGDGQSPGLTVGDWIPKAQQPLAVPGLIVPLHKADMPLLLRVSSASPTTLSLAALPAETWWPRHTREQFVYGLYYGLMAALLLYNLFLFAAIRNVAYLYYCLWLGGFSLFQFSWNGHLHAWLWPAQAVVPPFFTIGLLYVGILGGLKFSEHISHSAVLAPRMRRVLQSLAAVCLGMLLLAPLSAAVAIRAAPLIGAVCIGAIVHTLVLAGRQGYRPAVFTLAGFAALVPGGLALVLASMGVLDGSWLARHGMTVGSALDALILSFALADRINILNADKQRLQQDLLDAQQDYAKALLAAQDDERARLARELHDGIAQQLAAVAGRVRRLSRQGNAIQPQALSDAAAWAGDAVEDVRRISHRLHPQQLERLGLATAIEADARQQADAAGLRLTLACDAFDPASLGPHARLQCYRIAQEAVRNAVQHAGADTLQLSLESDNRQVRLCVQDNGRGLPPGRAGGLGLRSMRERAASAGGTLHLGTAPGGGLRVELELPVAP